MHDEGLEPLTERELRAMGDRELDRRIVAALERVADLPAAAPADFAARIAAKVPLRRPVMVARSTRYGPRAMWLGLAVVVAAMVLFSAFSTSAAGQPVMTLTVDSVLVLQFVAIVAWLSLRSGREG